MFLAKICCFPQARQHNRQSRTHDRQNDSGSSDRAASTYAHSVHSLRTMHADNDSIYEYPDPLPQYSHSEYGRPEPTEKAPRRDSSASEAPSYEGGARTRSSSFRSFASSTVSLPNSRAFSISTTETPPPPYSPALAPTVPSMIRVQNGNIVIAAPPAAHLPPAMSPLSTSSMSSLSAVAHYTPHSSVPPSNVSTSSRASSLWEYPYTSTYSPAPSTVSSVPTGPQLSSDIVPPHLTRRHVSSFDTVNMLATVASTGIGAVSAGTGWMALQHMRNQSRAGENREMEDVELGLRTVEENVAQEQQQSSVPAVVVRQQGVPARAQVTPPPREEETSWTGMR